MWWYTPCPSWVKNEIVNRWWARQPVIRGYTLAIEHYAIPGDPITLPTLRHVITNRWSLTAILILGQNERFELVSETAIRCNALSRDNNGHP